MREFRRRIKRHLQAPLFALLRGVSLGPLLWSRNRLLRHLLFEALGQSPYRGPLISRQGDIPFLHDSRDRGPGRDLFVRGAQDFGKLEKALDIVQRQGRPIPSRMVDVGANIGTICIPAVRRGAMRSAVAIEAVPSIVRLLRANIALNGLEDRIVVHAAAATDRDGDELTMAVNEANLGDNRVASTAATKDMRVAETVQVPTLTLDRALAGDGSDVLIWMDIQGHEGVALAGAQGVLASRPPVVAEFCPAMMRQAGTFHRFKDAVGHYGMFWDLDRGDAGQPIGALDALAERLGDSGRFTDILLL